MKPLFEFKTAALVVALAISSIPGKTQWVYKAPLHQGRAFFATEVVDRKIYVIGGATTRTKSTATMEVYDCDTDTWDTTKASLPVALCAAGSAVVGHKIYVIGGKPIYEDNNWLNTVYEYDTDSNTWKLLPYVMPTARAFLSACALGNEIYAIGGRTANVFSITTVEKLDPGKGWTTFQSLNAARSNLTTETLHGIIYVMAGVDAVNPTTVEKYNPAAGAIWGLTGENINRYLHGSTAWGGNIYLLGGVTGGSPNPLFDLVRYNPTKGFETLPGALPEVKGVCGVAVVEDCPCANKGNLFAIGGASIPFFFPTEPGSPVSASVLMYDPCIVSTKGPVMEPAPVLLAQNQPNPFSGQTTIQYEMQRPADICIQVFDLNGRVVATLLDEHQGPGRYSVTWDAAGVPEGVYLYQLRSNDITVTRKCILINH